MDSIDRIREYNQLLTTQKPPFRAGSRIDQLRADLEERGVQFDSTTGRITNYDSLFPRTPQTKGIADVP